MRVNRYAVDLDNGQTVTIGSCRNAEKAQRVIEETIRDGSGTRRYAGATQVTAVRLIERGRWG